MQKIWLEESCMEKARSSLRKRLEENVFPDDAKVLEQIDKLLLEGELKQIPLTEKLMMRKELFYSVRKLDILQELIDDPDITEIMVNGPDHIFFEKEGRIYNWNKKFTNRGKLMDVIQQIVGNCNRVVNESSPIVDARLENGDRVNVVVSPAALNGPILTIRRFPSRPIDMEQLLERDALTKDAADFLEWMVQEKQSIVVGGGTSTGKTTFLNALSAYIPPQERIITIEGTAELQLQNRKNLVRLEAKQANLEGGVTVTIRDLIHSALRMRPDRILIGELRGSEAGEMLFSVANSGHRGTLCTAHANSTYDMISRLETMVLMGMDIPMEAIDRQIASGIDLLVHLTRTKTGERKVTEITEVIGYENGRVQMNPLYCRKGEKGLIRINEWKGENLA